MLIIMVLNYFCDLDTDTDADVDNDNYVIGNYRVKSSLFARSALLLNNIIIVFLLSTCLIK